MTEALPQFPYHPDPLASGSVVASEATCACCCRARGFIYAGPVYAVDDLDDSLCPWCIADGSAAERFDATFTDDADVPDGVPIEVVDAVARRTPGFSAWQQDHWLYHCDDGAAFLGPAGTAQLRDHPDALVDLRAQCAELDLDGDEVEEFIAALDPDRSPTAYLFRCRHCGRHLAFADSD